MTFNPPLPVMVVAVVMLAKVCVGVRPAVVAERARAVASLNAVVPTLDATNTMVGAI
jgi:hypothetical protein